MGKDKKIVAIIRGKNNKGQTGFVEKFEAKSEKKVVVDFISGNDTQQVDYDDLKFPHHKAEAAAQNLKREAVTSWKSTIGANNAGEALQANEVATYHPAD